MVNVIHSHPQFHNSVIYTQKKLRKSSFFFSFFFLMSGKVTNVAATVIIVDLNTQSSGYF